MKLGFRLSKCDELYGPGQHPPVDTATVIATTDSSVSAATPSRLPVLLNRQVHVHVGDRPGDQREQPH